MGKISKKEKAYQTLEMIISEATHNGILKGGHIRGK
jgi:hypothetical protein